MIISKLIEVIFMFMLGMKEAFLSNNVELIGIIEHELRKKNIPYKVKTVNSGVLNRTTGTFVGRAGQSYNDLDIMYYIYSKLMSIEKARKPVCFRAFLLIKTYYLFSAYVSNPYSRLQ